jgi:hypothetical protein
MKTLIPMLALAISATVPTLLTADDETAQDHGAQRKQLEQQINDYWHVDSTWVGTVNMELSGNFSDGPVFDTEPLTSLDVKELL